MRLLIISSATTCRSRPGTVAGGGLLAGPAAVVGLVPAAVGQAASAAAATLVCQILGFLIDKSSDS